MRQTDIDAATVARAVERLRRWDPELAEKLAQVSHRLVGRVDQAPRTQRRSTTDRVELNGRTVMIVTRRRAQFAL